MLGKYLSPLWSGARLAPEWDFGPRNGLVPGSEPWSQEAFNNYGTSQIKSEKISDVPIGQCAWQGQNGHIACRDIKGSKEKSLEAGSIIRSLFFRHWTDLIVGGGFAGQPPAGLSCFAGQHIEEGTSLMMPCHRLKNITNNTLRIKFYHIILRSIKSHGRDASSKVKGSK